MLDIPTGVCALERLEQQGEALKEGSALPVGSVEYLREAMRIAGAKEPAGMSYPQALGWMMKRQWRQTVAAEVREEEFVKPVATKAFTGFVMPRHGEESGLGEHDKEQLEALRALPGDTPVYASERVIWLCEWRIYVEEGSEMGRGRYDPDGHDDAPALDEGEVRRAISDMVDAYGAAATFALDVGVLSDGRTALVEVNDMFALGLYAGSVTAREYLGMLWTRWTQILQG